LALNAAWGLSKSPARPRARRSRKERETAAISFAKATVDQHGKQSDKKEVTNMAGYVVDIEQKTLDNEHFREVLYTAPHSQLVVMTLQPGEEIGTERHGEGDQFVRVESGEGEAILDGEHHPLADGSAVVVPAGIEHNFVNTSSSAALRLYTIYTPPEHPDGTIHRTKAEADEYARREHGEH
jgi:mannose-6-phosphate isomerase-like protein (cupin superfamily)